MKVSERTLRISGALLIALIMVGGAYVLSGPSLWNSKVATAESTEALLAAYATKDTDSDGLPDWQETLYGTDLAKQDTDGDGIADAQAVRDGLVKPSALASQLPQDPDGEGVSINELPGTDPAPGSITERFSRSFFDQFVAASNGLPMDEATMQALIQKLLGQFSQEAAALLESRYGVVSVRTNASATTIDYAASVEAIFRNNDLPAERSQPLPLMQALIEEGDESARKNLIAVADAYRAMSSQLIALPVPPSMADEHLSLVRAFDELARSTRVISTYEQDPLGTLGALITYQESSNSLAETVTSIATVILTTGEPANGEAGSLLVFLGRIGE